MKKWMYNALIIFFSLVLVVSGGTLAWYYIQSHLQQSRYEDLSALRETLTPRPGLEKTETPTEPSMVEVTNPDTGETFLVLPEFAELYNLNSDLVGWMTIPGTDIDYPVMQTPHETDYYLKRDFDRKYSARGCLYAREVCDVFAPSDNITIYGHRMRDGTMFAQLHKYQDEAFFRENRYIYFDTLTELHTYEIVSVFLTTASVGEGFSYHLFVDAEDAADFEAFTGTCKALSLYDTGVQTQYGDKLITLSTCEYSRTNGRLVVVAKRVA